MANSDITNYNLRLPKIKYAKLLNRATLEKLSINTSASIAMIINRAIDREIESWKPLIKK